KTENKPLAMRLEGARIDLQVSSSLPAAFQSARRFLLDQFEAADVDKRGSLDKKQVQGNAFLAALFPAVEGDGGHKLSKEEFAALVDLLGKAVASSVVLT